MTGPAATYDAIVVGGGHNGLVAAAYLAKAGLRTVVLERRHLAGGAAITEELHPGYHFTTFSYALGLVRPDVVRELELVRHGYDPLPMTSTFCPVDDRDALLLGRDAAANRRALDRFARGDADGYERYSNDLDRVVRAVRPLFDAMAPDLTAGSRTGDGNDHDVLGDLAAQLRRTDRRVAHDLVRFLTGSAADIVSDYVRADVTRAWIASSGIIGAHLGPMSPGSALVLLYLQMGEINGVAGRWAFHRGGNGGFVAVLERAATAAGAEVRTGAEVVRVLTRSGAAYGVALADGTELHAPIVVSAGDPHTTFTRLVDQDELPDDLAESLRRYRYRGVSSKVNFALAGLPRHPVLDGLADPADGLRGFINVGPSIEYLERAFDEAKYGGWSPRPYLDACVQSTIDPDMAPPGRHVLSCFVQYTPYRLASGTWDEQRAPLGDAVQATLASYFPGFDDLVLHREVVTPLDIERVAGLPEGSIYHGELSPSQLLSFRPAPGWARYRTPIAGYYQCGSGTHPGGCVTGGPGRLAARQILQDRRD